MSDRYRGFLQMTLLALVSAAVFWLLREHWNHAFGFLPYLLFLACPLMHLFHHHGHTRRHDGSGEAGPKAPSQ